MLQLHGEFLDKFGTGLVKLKIKARVMIGETDFYFDGINGKLKFIN